MREDRAVLWGRLLRVVGAACFLGRLAFWLGVVLVLLAALVKVATFDVASQIERLGWKAAQPGCQGPHAVLIVAGPNAPADGISRMVAAWRQEGYAPVIVGGDAWSCLDELPADRPIDIIWVSPASYLRVPDKQALTTVLRRWGLDDKAPRGAATE